MGCIWSWGHWGQGQFGELCFRIQWWLCRSGGLVDLSMVGIFSFMELVERIEELKVSDVGEIIK